MIIISLLVLTLVGGYTLGAKFGSSHESINPNDSQSNELFQSLIEKFQELTSKEIQEYLVLKKEEDRFKKADEILEKIIKIFLSDLRLKVDLAKFQELHLHPAAAAIPNRPELKSKDLIHAEKIEEAGKAPAKLEVPAAVSEPARERHLLLRAHAHGTEINEYLKSQISADLYQDLKKSKSLDIQMFRRLFGRYSGRIIGDPTETPIDMEMAINGHLNRGKVEGDFARDRVGRPISESAPPQNGACGFSALRSSERV